jgi:ribonuclease-3
VDSNDQERVARLEERLGLQAGALPLPLALEALRHGSYVHERRGPSASEGRLRSNERLEFLGDAVLGLLVSVRCCDLFPDLSEGALTRLRAAVVNAEALAQVARAIGLGELLLLGRGEERSGGRVKQSLLADALEAVLAAVYLGCGLEAARAVVDRLLAPLFQAAVEGSLGRDYKTELQEIAQSVHRSSPAYRVLDAPGPQHARVFDVEVALGGAALGRGSGRTKKEAEQAAAKAALEALAAARPAAAEATPEGAAAPPTPAAEGEPP